MPDEPSAKAERSVYRFFEISVLLKGIDAAFEIVVGLLALAIDPAFIHRVAVYFTSAELGQDPDDVVAHYLRHLADEYVTKGHHIFVAAYLLSHGLIKIALVIGLLRNKLWAYPAAIVVFGLFTVYQLYLYIHDHSLTMLVLTILDIIVLWFIWREYAIVLARRRDKEELGSA